MLELIKQALGLVLGGENGPGGLVTNGVKLASLAAIAPAAWFWYQGHGADVVVSFTWTQLAVVAALVYAFVQIAHKSN